jgi:hypothetical protein
MVIHKEKKISIQRADVEPDKDLFKDILIGKNEEVHL